MFRELRRKNKAIDSDSAKALLKEARYGVLAVNGDEEYPYAVPVNFLYDEDRNRIYFHGSFSGHKADSLKKSDKVCFTVVGPEETRDESWAPYAKSTVVFDRCHAVENKEEALSLCRRFAVKYYPTEESVSDAMEEAENRVCMYVIEIEHISGKMIQEK